MDHTAAQIALSAWLDGELSPQEAQELQEHLDQCPQCRALQEELSAISSLLRETPDPAVPPALKEKVMANLPPQRKSRGKLTFIHWKRWGAMAAAAALVIAAAVWFRSSSLPSQDSAEVADAEHSLVSDEAALSSAPESDTDVAPTAGSVLTGESSDADPDAPPEASVAQGEAIPDGFVYTGIAANGKAAQGGDTTQQPSGSGVSEAAPDSGSYAAQSYGVSAQEAPMARMSRALVPTEGTQDAGLESIPMNLAPEGENGSAAFELYPIDALDAEENLPEEVLLTQAKLAPEEALQLPEDEPCYFAVLTIPSARVGLLQGYYYTTWEDGSALYLLPATQFDALVAELSQSEATYTLEASGDSPSAPYGLVIVASPMA